MVPGAGRPQVGRLSRENRRGLQGCQASYNPHLALMAASRSLVIVESPAKARTIGGFLGKGFVVESSIGHIRDLPTPKELPESMRKGPFSKYAVDVENGFKPFYMVDADKKQHIQKLKGLLAEADELYLATDEDREGEAIAWHLFEVLKPKVPVKRMVFHEITKSAIKQAIDNPRTIDTRLVEAQEARRILDRLYGYELSPVLWRKVETGLSAGRVQSVATRIIVDRERQRMRFVRAAYWDLEATLTADSAFTAQLTAVDKRRVATSKDFDESGKIERPNVLLLDEAAVKRLADGLTGEKLKVESVERKPMKRTPAAPFMTSTLQQEASRKLRFAAKRAMSAAQKLYEGGYITYMRTDSTQLSSAAIGAARALIAETFGAEYLPAEPRVYAKKVKNAQEAHEAIRPAGDTFRRPEEVAREVGPDEAKLYELVWMRTIASQMKDSQGESVQVRLLGRTKHGQDVELSASGYTITFPGFLRAYVEGSDDPAAELEGRERPLPPLKEGQVLPIAALETRFHETQPPARYTEASLVQKMEELGVGRPSTYASTIGTITSRGYVWKKGAALVPSLKAFAVTQLLEKHFEALVDYTFTAKMEDDLDAIAEGAKQSEPWLERFFFGEVGKQLAATKKPKSKDPKSKEPKPKDAATEGGIQTLGLQHLVAERMDEIDARTINAIPIGTDPEGREIVAKSGKYGPYLACGEERASLPEDLPLDELTVAKALELLAAGAKKDVALGSDPATGKPVYVKNGRNGAYVQLGDQEGDEKPKRTSLLRTQTPSTLTFEQALQLLTIPREVGKHPETKEPILARLGQYGPYITCGKESRNIESEELVFTITLEDAVARLAQKRVGRQRAEVPPLKSFPEDAVSKKPIVVKQGRFGMYVTDGETNATLRSEDTLESLTHERAQELLQMRRDRGDTPKPGKRGAKKAAPKAAKTKAKPAAEEGGAEKAANAPAAKKAAAKKPAAKKSAAKKPAAKKPAKG